MKRLEFDLVFGAVVKCVVFAVFCGGKLRVSRGFSTLVSTSGVGILGIGSLLDV